MKGWQLRVASLLLMLALSRVLEQAADELEAHEDRAQLEQLEQLPGDDLEQPDQPGDVDDLDGDDLPVFSRDDLPAPPARVPCGRCKRCRCGDRRHGGRR